MENGLIRTQVPGSITESINMGKVFFESGLFSDLKSAAQAVVKIQAGAELGIAPFASLTGIHIILGKPVLGAGVIASKVKSSGKYDYKVVEMSDIKCSLDFYQGKEKIGNSTFTVEDAKKAGTKNLDKFPKNMLFARAISNGVKWFTPDVFSGPVYTPEEMNQVTEDTQAEISTATPQNGIHKEDVSSIVTEPSDFQKEEDQKKEEVIPGHWYAKLEKCLTPEDVDILGVAHKETVNANPQLRKLFVKRKAELKPVISKTLPF